MNNADFVSCADSTQFKLQELMKKCYEYDKLYTTISFPIDVFMMIA